MAALQAFANKKYKLDSSENFDDFMKALGVSFVTRQVGNAVSPVVHLTVDGDKYTLTSTSSFKTSTISFKLGEPFDQETPDGRKVKATITLEGDNTLVENQEGSGKTTKIVREFSANEIKMILTVDNIVCTRIYKLQE
ncbi:fatty acid-binding protein, muscle isoform X1 [Frankliniella occidentalis]|uniref:Fatty acid-binding protein, muscle n=1 Tax=Frankliniella occidentalis TaxID=133901 RepID=A0A6J1RRR7_FRAOC|nr:fatty acid-binding protein, muscle isoform X1 [Frankliniella occidentalis]